MKFIGIDVSKDTFDYCKAGQNKVIKLDNTPEGWDLLKADLSDDSWVVMEATGPYFFSLAAFLTEQEIKVSVINPLVIKHYGRVKMNRIKTDAVDARLIADYGQTMRDDLQVWQPKPANARTIQQLNTNRSQILKQITQIKNQTHAFLRDEQACTKAVDINNRRLQFNLDILKEVEREIDDLAKEEFQDLIKRISTIPGIGKKTATLFCVLTDGFSRFSSHQQLSTYIGIAPSSYESGTSVKGKGHISKKGAGYMRKQLYMCALSASRFNPACRQLYERLTNKGKNHNVIMIAVAHKLLRQVFMVAVTGAVYDQKKALAA